MSDEPLLTLKQLAEELHLPESTVRYYRDAFLDHIPSVGAGRRRRYPREAIAVLRSIADDYAAGRPRRHIAEAMTGHGTTSPALALPAEQPSRAIPLEDVTNLDLLAAILDGEREQRDALWQMAKEIVRLTEVLEGQDKVLTEIADHAGVTSLPPLGRPVASLAAPERVLQSASTVPAPPPPPPPRAEAPARQEHVLKDGARHGDMNSLRDELEAERALVERLREAKLQLEHRAADAEAALEEKRTRRPSLVQRLLRPDR